MVDILCGVLSGGAFGRGLYDAPNAMARVSHFFLALRVDSVREPAAFRRDLDSLLEQLRATPLAEGAERVYFAGLKEFEREAEATRLGVPVARGTYDAICDIGESVGVDPPGIAA
jgi:LDH2 family malate/lactate/ureidoglycolate dehydrogenase